MKPHTPLKLNIVNCNGMSAVKSSVVDTLCSAQREGRLTCGVYESGKLLQIDPCGVMLCILPDNRAQDVTLQIHYTLIQAYCWENDIQLLKVDSCDKLSRVLSSPGSRPSGSRPCDGLPALDNADAQPKPATDFNCVLVQYPEESCSEAEEDVLEYCRVTADLNPLPVIALDE